MMFQCPPHLTSLFEFKDFFASVFKFTAFKLLIRFFHPFSLAFVHIQIFFIEVFIFI